MASPALPRPKPPRFNPQSFPAVRLSDPLNPFSPPAPRQRIKRGMLVIVNCTRTNSDYTIQRGRWLATVVETKAERAAKFTEGLTYSYTQYAGWKVRLLCNLASVGVYTTKDFNTSHYGVEATCATVALANPWKTVGYCSDNQPFAKLDKWHGQTWPVESEAYGQNTLSDIGVAYIVAANSIKRRAKTKLAELFVEWNNHTSKHYQYIAGQVGYPTNRTSAPASAPITRTNRRRQNYMYWRQNNDRVGKALAVCLATLRKLPDEPVPSEPALSLILQKAEESGYYRAEGDKAAVYIRTRWNLALNSCGHYGTPTTVRRDTYGRTHNYCPDCIERHTRSGRFVAAILTPTDTTTTLVDTQNHSVYDHGDGVMRGYAPPKMIGAYHSSKQWFRKPMPHITGKKPTHGPHVGMELEFVRDGRCTADLNILAKKMRDLLAPYDKIVKDSGQGEYYALFEYDGSVDYEMVTGFGPLDTHRAAVIALLGQGLFKGELKSHDGGRCGLHVHLDKPTSLRHAARMTEFYNKRDNERLITAVARRYSSGARYAKVVPGKGGDRLASQKHKAVKCYGYGKRDSLNVAMKSMTDDRYELLNFQPEKTVEVRAFRGSMVASTVIACLEFAYLSWFFARDCRVMGTDEFIEFIGRVEWRHESRYLRKYLVGKGYTPWMPSKLLTGEEVDTNDETEEVSLPAMGKVHPESTTTPHGGPQAQSSPTSTTMSPEWGPWIEWRGGERPVDTDRVPVRYRMRSQAPETGYHSAFAYQLRWNHGDSSGDIVQFSVPVGTWITPTSDTCPVPGGTMVEYECEDAGYNEQCRQLDEAEEAV